MLCRNILFHCGLVTFRIHLGKTREPIIFMGFGPGGHDHDSNKQCLMYLNLIGAKRRPTNKYVYAPLKAGNKHEYVYAPLKAGNN